MTCLRPVFPTLALLLPLAMAVAGAVASDVRAAELVMLERPGCGWCLRWNTEIAPIYPKTSEGRQAPLRRVDITAPWPADLAGIASDRYTPTFIVVENGVEIARLRGYPGENFFWPMLSEMLARLPDGATPPAGSGQGG